MDNLKKWKPDPSKGEVFTPIELVNLILDEIPSDVWLNSKSNFLDPCMGTGTFLSEIVRRLVDIYGYSELDAKSRVYGYEIRIKYINKLKRRGYVNIHHKDFLSDKIKMKFDVVIGNPPYQEVDNNGKSKGGGKGGANNLWSKFIIKSMEISDNVFFITPPSFLSPNHLVLKKMYESGGLKLLKIFDESPFIGVGTQACYYYWSKNYDGLCKIGGESISLKDKILPNSSNPIDFSIFNKFFSKKEKYTFESNSQLHKTNKKHLLSVTKDDVFIYKTYHASKIIYSSFMTENYPKLKVVISDSGYLNPIIDTNCNTTQHSFFHIFDSKADAEFLIKLLNTKLYQKYQVTQIIVIMIYTKNLN